MQRQTKLIVALDLDSREQALAAMRACSGCDWFKIGLQLFSRTGPALSRYLLANDKQVFLDLKLHDIPNTVSHAAKAASELGVNFITVHASGGKRMIAAARDAVEGSATRILAVTVLTSISEEELRREVGMPETPAQAVARLAALAVDAGAHGLVCSPLEIGVLRETIGQDPIIVTPGVRPEWAGKDDQSRITTPRQAAEAGADFVVVGRPVLKHANPGEAVDLIKKELAL
jgi:orotidine-5'-phosphate decarboxylase